MNNKQGYTKRIPNLMKFIFIQIVIAISFNGLVLAIDMHGQDDIIEKEITLDFTDTKLKEVIRTIEDKTDFSFVYSSKAIKAKRKVSIKAENQPLNEIFINLFTPLNISYKIIDNHVLLSAEKDKKTPKLQTIKLGSHKVLLEPTSKQQGILDDQRTITGTVSDRNSGETLIGCNVIIEGTSNGTTTDVNGNFSLLIATDAKFLLFSYTGYEDQKVEIGTQDVYNIALNEQAFGLEAITVTARKTIENVQEVPLAVAAFSAQMLENRGVSNVGQLADYIPNVEIDVNTAFGGSQSVLSPFIRGIGQNDFAITFEPAVGLYVDGVYYGRGVGSVVDMLDVERIEVLKGPQGTLFGRNTIGGAINVTTTKPSNEFGGKAQVTTGSYNRIDTRVSVDLPIVKDKLLSTFSMASNTRDGYVERIPYLKTGDEALNEIDQRVHNTLADGIYSSVGNNNDQGNYNNQTIRGKLFYDVADNFKITLVSDYVRVRENESPASLLNIDLSDPSNLASTYNLGTIINADNETPILSTIPTPPGLPEALEPVFYELLFNFSDINGFDNPYPLFGRTPYDNRFLTDDPFTNYSTEEAGSRIDVWGGALTLDWDINDNIKLKSITSLRRLRSDFAQDGDYSPLDWSKLKLTMPQDQFTQEFQFTGKSDKLNWAAGLYHFQEEGSVLDEVYFGAGLIQVYGLNIVDNKTYAAYGQATYNITDAFSVTAGARFTNEQKFLDGRQRELNCFGCLVTPPPAFPTEDPTLYFPPGGHDQEFNEPTFRFGLEYKITDDIFAYGSFAQGFKSGGWSTRLTAPSLTAPAFNPERSNTFEIGVKSEFLDNTLRLNATYFNTAYQEMQVTVFRGISPTVINAAEAAISGIELDLQWRATDNVLFVGNLGILNAEYSSFDTERLEAEGFTLRVDENSMLLNAPDMSFGLGLDLTTTQDVEKGRFGLHIDYNFRSDVANDVENTPLLIQEGFGLLNGYVYYEPAGRKWKLTVGGTNLTDERYINAGTFNPSLGNTFATYGRPVEWSTGISFNF